MSKLKNEYMPKGIPHYDTIFVKVSVFEITPILTIVAGSMMAALFILIIEKVHDSIKTRCKNNKLFIKKFSHNLDVKNKLQNRNDDLNRILKEFYYNRPFGYWP